MKQGWFVENCPCQPYRRGAKLQKIFKTVSTNTEPSLPHSRHSLSHIPLNTGSQDKVEEKGACGGAKAPSASLATSRSLDLSELEKKSDRFSVFNPGYKSTTPPEDAVSRPLSTVAIPLEETGSMNFAFFPKHNSKGNESQVDMSQLLSKSLERVKLDDLVEGQLWQINNIPKLSQGKDKHDGKKDVFSSPQKNAVVFNSPQKTAVVTESSKTPQRVASPPISLALGVRQSLERRSARELRSCTKAHTFTSSKSTESSPVIRRVHRSESTPGIVMGSSSRMHQRNIRSNDHPIIKHTGKQCSLAGNGAGISLDPFGRPHSAIDLMLAQPEDLSDKSKHRQSDSFTLSAAGFSIGQSDKEMSQSCEVLPARKKVKCDRDAKRRCPTPPRVLSPNLEPVKYEFLADI